MLRGYLGLIFMAREGAVWGWFLWHLNGLLRANFYGLFKGLFYGLFKGMFYGLFCGHIICHNWP